MIQKFQRAYENLRKTVDRQNKRIRDLEEQLDEYKKRHPSNTGARNDKAYEIKPKILPQPGERKKPGQKKEYKGFFCKSSEGIDHLPGCRYTDAKTALQG